MLKLFVKSKMALADLKKNIEGATLIEYSLLIGLLSALVVALIVVMGQKVDVWWTALNDATSATTP